MAPESLAKLDVADLIRELGIDKLPESKRIELAHGILNQMEEDPFPLTPEQLEEVERRLDDLERRPDQGIPWPVLKAELEAKLERRG